MATKKKKNINVPNLRFLGFSDPWEKFRFQDVMYMSSGGTPSMERADYWDGHIPFISAASMHDAYISSANQRITEDGLKNGSKLLKKGNLLLLVRGSMLWRRIPICYNNIDVAFNQDVKGLVPTDKTNSNFMLYWFQSKESILKYMVTGTGIGAGKIDSGNISALQPLLPEKAEQLKISRLFSLLDDRINTQNKIIENLETQIKTTMKIIFTMKAYDFKSCKLRLLCSIRKGEQINSSQLSESGIYGVINGGITPSGYHSYFNSEAETISISEGGNSCGYVQFNKKRFWSGGHCYTLIGIVPYIASKYLYYFLKYSEQRIMALRVGSGLPNIQKRI